MENRKCPVCGMEMELHEYTSECVGGDGWNTPYEYRECKRWYCPECGDIEEEIYVV